MSVPSHVRSAFGISIVSTMPLPGGWRASGKGQPEVELTTVEPELVERLWSGRRESGWTGRDIHVEHGALADTRMELESAVLHLSADGKRLLIAARDPGDPAFLRRLLDSALFTVSLRLGYEGLHAAAVEIGGAVLAIAGPEASGKSSLAAALIRKGARFFSDDVLIVQRGKNGVTAYPGPPTMTISSGDTGREDVLLDLGSESWVAVEGASGPSPLASIVCLGPEGHPPLPTPMVLLPHLLAYPRSDSRRRARFELCVDLARRSHVERIAARSAAPSDLADRVLEEFASTGTAGAGEARRESS